MAENIIHKKAVGIKKCLSCVGKKQKLTQNRLKDVLFYNQETGLFFWKKKTGHKVIVGKKAGGNSRGYRSIGVDGDRYFAHRLAWLYVYGYFPENDIDHINRIKRDNRIKNLREVSSQCNLRNTGNRKNNTSGIKGVSWDERTKRWIPQITINKKNRQGGYYKHFDDAVCGRLAMEQCLGWEGCGSSSPAYKYVQKNIIKKGNCNETRN